MTAPHPGSSLMSGEQSGGMGALPADAGPGHQPTASAPSGLRGVVSHSAEQEAIRLAYGLLWHMRIDARDDNLKLASDARKALLAVMSKDDQFRGIDAAKMTDGRFTGAA